jgi:mannose-6-phosphate isomerase
LILLYPLLLEPALHVKVWGGRKLDTLMHKTLPTDEPYGESWELHDTAKVANGAYAGQTIGDVLKAEGAALIGSHNNPAEGFPLLVKFLDAADWLSVQVHPNDAYAAQLEGEPRGKTEAWYILDADEGSQLVIGVLPGSSREAVAEAISDSALEKLLVYADVEVDDVLYISAGTIHALGPGLLIYEIQQSSDLTYRLYDWGRMGLDGKPRPLHIEKSLIVSNTESLPQLIHADQTGKTVSVIQGEYFLTLRHDLNQDSVELDTRGQVFHALTCIEGQVEARAGEVRVPFHVGQSVLIPASIGTYTLSGAGRVLNSMQNV